MKWLSPTTVRNRLLKNQRKKEMKKEKGNGKAFGWLQFDEGR
jgi:hypothetical protein